MTMKLFIMLFFTAVLANQSYAQKSKYDTLVVHTKIYCDHCKECETCKPHMERDLSFAKGVKSSSVNVESQTVSVIYNSKKTNPGAIRKALASAGYDADEVKAEPKAVAKLDDCCRMK